MKFDLGKDKLLILLISADLVFVFLHILHVDTDLLPSNRFSLSRDRGYAEFFQYTKELGIAVLCFLWGVKQRRKLYFVFSFLFLYFLFDDSFKFHERFGEFLAGQLNLQPVLGLRAIDMGELLVSAIFGLLFVISIAVFYRMSDQIMRKNALYLIGMVVLLFGFGVLLDMVEILSSTPGTARVLTALEEAGEMLVMSAITWVVFHLDTEAHPDPIAWLLYE